MFGEKSGGWNTCAAEQMLSLKWIECVVIDLGVNKFAKCVVGRLSLCLLIIVNALSLFVEGFKSTLTIYLVQVLLGQVNAFTFRISLSFGRRRTMSLCLKL